MAIVSYVNKKMLLVHLHISQQLLQLFFIITLGAMALHRQFLKHVLGVRGNTATLIVLAEFGGYPLHFYWWQQILRYHNPLPEQKFLKEFRKNSLIFSSKQFLEIEFGNI